ncbi:hypothetical protein L7F22_023931 [Adiantum nelumboides]|nr:hypothetical protein [Adiantum nelumboides]
MRSKLEPPLPKAYFGNAVIRDRTVEKKEEIEEESVGAIALQIQKLIKRLDEKIFRTFYGNFEVLPFRKLFDEAEFKMVMMQATGSSRFSVYEVDFGWGPPLFVKSPNIRDNGEMKNYQNDTPVPSKLNPEAKEWDQQRSSWKEKGKAKEFDEWKKQRELAAKITEKLDKKKQKVPECSKARTIQRIPIAVTKALLLKTQRTDGNVLPVDSFDDNNSSGNEQDEIAVKMC